MNNYNDDFDDLEDNEEDDEYEYDYEPEWDDDEDLIDGVGFAAPGGNSALRAATPNNPRIHPCPQCGRENMLTPIDMAHHYVCDRCADSNEGFGF